MKHTTLHINDSAQSSGYDIHIGSNIVKDIASLCNFSIYSGIFFITDEQTLHLCEAILPHISQKTATITVSSGDNNKNIETVQEIWKQLLDAKCDRKGLIVDIGGGVIGDMGGFAASTYMRGIDFVQVPTTVLAQVDASVGGKVGINFNGIKNSIGAFKQPAAVVIDIDTLETLPDRPFIAGFGEIIKHGLIADAEYFKQVTGKKPREFTKEELVDIIARSVEIKKNIVEHDLSENGQRKLVNFGHTYGHAIESMSQTTEQPLLHGEAVSIGMVMAAKLSQKMGFLSESDVQTIAASLQHAGLPTTYAAEDKQMLHKKMLADKKNVGGKIKWTLLKRIGEGVYDQEVPQNIIEEVLTA